MEEREVSVWISRITALSIFAGSNNGPGVVNSRDAVEGDQEKGSTRPVIEARLDYQFKDV